MSLRSFDTRFGAFYRVYDRLGFGFLEVVYKRALVHELRKLGLRVRIEAPVEVWYDSICLGHYRVDVLVNEVVIIEVKAAELMPPSTRAQTLNCLRASNLQVGLALNFGIKPQFLRLMHTTKGHDKKAP